MGVEEAIKNIPKQGFIKLSLNKTAIANNKDKVVLNRKGNELFNRKEYDLAKRIFITTGYGDGLIRLGDYYMENNQPLEAFRMYWLASCKGKVEAMTEKMAKIIKFWLLDKQKGIKSND